MPRSYILSGEHDFLGENGPETRSEKEASQRRKYETIRKVRC